jgi:hypothetical protein
MKQHDPKKYVREYERAVEETMPLRERVCLGQFLTHADRSEETLCFHAILAIDGQAVARISNDGRGGCMDLLPLAQDGVMEIISAFAYEVRERAQAVTEINFHLESFLTALVHDTATNARTIR